MSNYQENKFIKYGIPLITFFLALLGFLQTVQRTTSFWDCGEFIATSYILGVPHPPGASFFNLLGRVFALLPIGGEIAWRINLISVFSSAFAILFMYLVLKEVMEYFFPVRNIKQNIINSFSAGSAALITAFCDTFWFNAVEAEVYALAMCFLFIATYLAMLWYKKQDETGSDRYLLLMFFVMFLGISVQMFSLLFFPAIFVLIVLGKNQSIMNYIRVGIGLFFVFVSAFILNKINSPGKFFETILHSPVKSALDKILVIFPLSTRKSLESLHPEYVFISLLIVALVIWWIHFFEKKEIVKDWKYWVIFIQLTLVIYAIDLFLWVSVFSLIAYGYLSFKSKLKFKFRFMLIAVLVAFIGYSTSAYVPIRSNLNPSIDENNPETWAQFKTYLERKQYGEPDIWTRITTRKGSFGFQFMYMANYLINQYSSSGFFWFWLFFFLIGFYFIFKFSKNKNITTFVFLIFMIVSIGLIIYMNFSDGTRGTHAEVRDRDYFHTPTFMMFMFFVGIGFAGLIHFLRNQLNMKYTAHYLAFPLLLLPIIPYLHNLPTHDRSKDFMPNDYAHNILTSCPENAILFTQGDNDTFPLWFIQSVKKFRTDIKVVNLSLLNARWYIKQLFQIEPKIKFGMTEQEIDRELAGARPLHRDLHLKHKDFKTTIQKNQYLKVQDMGIWQILKMNYGERPICFSMTVSPGSRIGLDQYLTKTGMVYEVSDTVIQVDTINNENGSVVIDTVRKGPIINKEQMKDVIVNQFKYTNFEDSTLYLGKEGSRYVYGYAQLFKELSEAYGKAGNSEMEEKALKLGTEKLPYVPLANYLMADYYFKRGQVEQAVVYYERAAWNAPVDLWYANYYLGVSYNQLGNKEKALEAFEKVVKQNQRNSLVIKELVDVAIELKEYERGKKAVEFWLQRNPNDNLVQGLLEKLNETQNK